jgi:hypothetical protein
MTDHTPSENTEVKKPKIICRAIDWEVWIGLCRDEAIADWVDEVILSSIFFACFGLVFLNSITFLTQEPVMAISLELET